MIGSIDARLVYKNAIKKMLDKKGYFANYGYTPENLLQRVILSQSNLRLEVELDYQKTEYQFPVTVQQSSANNQNQSIYETRVQLQDSFFASHIGAFVQIYDGTADFKRDYLFQFSSIAMTQPGNLVDPDLIKVLWQGNLALTVDQRVQTPGWDVWRHYNAPQTQCIVGGGPTSPYQDQEDGSQDGFYPCEPNWIFVGSKNNVLKYNLPHAIGDGFGAALKAGTVKMRLVLIFRGVLAQNSTSVR